MGLWSGRSRVLWMSSGSLLKKWPSLDPHIGLPLYNEFTTGAKFARFQRFRLCFFPLTGSSHGCVMAINMVRRCLKAFWSEYCSLPKSRALAPLLRVAQMTLLGTGAASPQSQVHERWRSLTKNEFQINPARPVWACGRIVAHDDMMKELWNSDFFIDDNTLSVNGRLRKLRRGWLVKLHRNRRHRLWVSPWINMGTSFGSMCVSRRRHQLYLVVMPMMRLVTFSLPRTRDSFLCDSDARIFTLCSDLGFRYDLSGLRKSTLYRK